MTSSANDLANAKLLAVGKLSVEDKLLAHGQLLVDDKHLASIKMLADLTYLPDLTIDKIFDRVTLVVAFGFLPPECWVVLGRDTQTLPTIKIIFVPTLWWDEMAPKSDFTKNYHEITVQTCIFYF